MAAAEHREARRAHVPRRKPDDGGRAPRRGRIPGVGSPGRPIRRSRGWIPGEVRGSERYGMALGATPLRAGPAARGCTPRAGALPLERGRDRGLRIRVRRPVGHRQELDRRPSRRSWRVSRDRRRPRARARCAKRARAPGHRARGTRHARAHGHGPGRATTHRHPRWPGREGIFGSSGDTGAVPASGSLLHRPLQARRDRGRHGHLGRIAPSREQLHRLPPRSALPRRSSGDLRPHRGRRPHIRALGAALRPRTRRRGGSRGADEDAPGTPA